MVSGVVKWFHAGKGHGFITQDGDEADVFVHYSAIISAGFRELFEGEEVTFAIDQGPRGPEAVNVVRG